jgi:DNA polymerase III subunit delta'
MLCITYCVKIIGHQKIQNFLKKSIEKNTVFHAYLFVGPEHLGKFSVAYDFAQKLTGNCNELNPDIIIVKPDIEENKGIVREKEIKIEKIREFQRQLGITSHFGKYKIGLIDKAERMNKSAQNSLLKTLEEPADNVIIILITNDSNKILPTIKSRCMIKKFNLVSDLEIEKILPANPKNKEEIIFWSLGRPGLVKKMEENPEELEKRRETEKELVKLTSANVSEKMAYAEKAGKDTTALVKKMNWWLILLRENLMEGKREHIFAKDKALDIIGKIEKSIKLIQETNSNSRLVLENLLMEFHPV